MKKTLLILVSALSIGTSVVAKDKLFNAQSKHKQVLQEKLKTNVLKHDKFAHYSNNAKAFLSKGAASQMVPSLTQRYLWDESLGSWYNILNTQLIVENGIVKGNVSLSEDLQDTSIRYTFTRDDLGRVSVEITEIYDTITSKFVYMNRTTSTYSPDGLTTTIISENYNQNNNTWEAMSKSEYIKNDRGEWIGYAYYYYTVNGWFLNAKYISRIDYLNQNSNKITLQVDSAYENNSMKAEYKLEVQYDSNEQEQTMRTYELGSNGLYLFSIDSIFYANAVPNQVIITYYSDQGIEEFKEKYYNINFENYNPQTPIYDQTLMSYYNSFYLIGSWEESARFNRTNLDNFGSYTELQDSYIGNNNYRENYSYTLRYNSFGIEIESIEKEFNVDSNKLVVIWGSINHITYDANNNIIERYRETHTSQYNRFVKVDKYVFSNFILISTNILRNKTNKLSVYPNPLTSNTLTIVLDHSNFETSSIGVYSLDGKLLIRDELILNGNKTELNVEDLEAGIYLIKVNSNGKTFQSKFIKE